jgi:hypothetical protein
LPEVAFAAAQAAIPVAATLVTENLAGEGLSEATLRSIELYLAAHFTTLAWEKGPLAAVQIGEATERYHDIYKAGFSSTRFGQQALLLDTTGILSDMSANAASPMRRAEFTVIGTPDTDPLE